ncbi:hypothetical protein [Saccharopolyspora rosea]|uniref:Guanylate cyclase domain-containing protein n=1 Tax=Saccharopolyspora rosea TaxID=524884 RepID=A0ABW3G598_9PSEU|nr:hypothetical protein [Saccharopolyspora rosea]
MDQELPVSDRPIGEYQGMLAVDVRHFSRHDDVQQRMIAEELLPDVLQRAASRAGFAELWHGRRFRAFRGDGYLLGFHPDLAAAVVDRFFDSLQAELRRRTGEFRSVGVELRLRASLHLGPVQSFNALLADSPSGKVMVDAGRMVDAEPVRSLLDRSDPDVTLVASVLSRAVMEHVVEAGQSTRRPSEFVEAPLRVEAKEYAGTGYLRVPAPSGELLSAGLLQSQPTSRDSASSGAPEAGVDAGTFNALPGNAGVAVQAAHVEGGVQDNQVHGVSGGVVAGGNGSVSIGHGVDQSSHKQEFSGQFNTQGDSNFGPSSGRRGSDVAGG